MTEAVSGVVSHEECKRNVMRSRILHRTQIETHHSSWSPDIKLVIIRVVLERALKGFKSAASGGSSAIGKFTYTKVNMTSGSRGVLGNVSVSSLNMTR